MGQKAHRTWNIDLRTSNEKTGSTFFRSSMSHHGGFAALRLAFAAFLFLSTSTVAQQPNTPHIGYLYPAGGRQGSTFQIVAGGQFLAGATNACVEGDGIQASVIEYDRPMPIKQFNELRDQLKALQQKRRAASQAARQGGRRGAAMNSTNVWTAADQQQFVEIRSRLLKNPPNRQGNPAIAETVLVQVTVATNAAPGPRELRLGTPAGLSNPLPFHAGTLREYSRPATRSVSPELNRLRKQFGLEPENPSDRADLRIALPATVNGQILPGGMDGYRFFARQGQRLVASVRARELIPYLADAVPGWFQATLTLCDAAGTELANAERYTFHPDPVLRFDVPKDGDYVVRIRDSIYRGREDFVYRLTLGELPFVAGIFPLGGPAGGSTPVQLRGWNLVATNVMRDDTNTAAAVDFFSVNGEKGCRALRFAADVLPECVESETNDDPPSAQRIDSPIIINGRIDRPGDVDRFQFPGRAGQSIVAEVWARRLGSPLDSVLTLTDASGRQIAWNDDHEDKSQGLETHHADSWLCAHLPAAGMYGLCLRDAQQHGGPDYSYRLRVSAPQPDFSLRVVPSSINVRAGLSVPITVYALRQDGCTNAIHLALKEPAAGFQISGGVVPAGQDQVRLTLSAPSIPPEDPVTLTLEGQALIQGKFAIRRARPADDLMQAFAYHHLVCAREWKVTAMGKGWPKNAPVIQVRQEGPLKLPAGGTARVRVAGPGWVLTNRFEFALSDPPAGIRLGNVDRVGRQIQLTLHSDAARTEPGASGNLIVELVPRGNSRPGQKPPAMIRHRPAAGTLPAIPFTIVSPTPD